MKLMNKKAQSLNGLQVAIMGFAGIAVTIAIVLFILAQMQTSLVSVHQGCGAASNSTNTEIVYTNCTAALGDDAYVSTGTLLTKIATIPTWIGILIVVVFATAVLGYFFMKQ